MSGLVCLQGGAEFGPTCASVDRRLLRLHSGPVVLVPLAAKPGWEYDTAGANGARWYGRLGAAQVTVAPDARRGPAEHAETVAMLAEAALVVLPGGSPARLLDAFASTGLDADLRDVLARGGALCGASAGAMVLCEQTVVPEQGPPRLVPGLGIVPGVCVLPHYRNGPPTWLRTVTLPPSIRALGIPECTGVLVEPGGLSWVGPVPAVWVSAAGTSEPLPPASA